MKKLLISAALAVAMAGAAGAQTFDWSGPYAGVNVGWGSSTQQWTSTAAVTTGSFSGDGVIGGVTLGHNWQSGNVVYGLEGDFGISSVSATNTTTGGCSAIAPCTADLGWLATARGRIGLATADNLLLFATGGLAVGKVDNSQTALSPLATASTTKAGWTVGLGLEAALANDWSAKFEVDYVDLGETDFCPIAGCGVAVVSDYTRVTIIKVGVNKHF